MKTQKNGTTRNATDKLVANLTAFKDWNDMVECMKDGYVPTLNGGKAYSRLADLCRRNGFKVYRNGSVI